MSVCEHLVLGISGGGVSFLAASLIEHYFKVPQYVVPFIAFILGAQAGRVGFAWWLRRQRK
jgi:tetrahydromethanopterin S-methyltransferase subunit C